MTRTCSYNGRGVISLAFKPLWAEVARDATRPAGTGQNRAKKAPQHDGVMRGQEMDTCKDNPKCGVGMNTTLGQIASENASLLCLVR